MPPQFVWLKIPWLSTKSGAVTKNCEHGGIAPTGRTVVRSNLNGIVVLAAATVVFLCSMRCP
jgi:hypothetical protein